MLRALLLFVWFCTQCLCHTQYRQFRVVQAAVESSFVNLIRWSCAPVPGICMISDLQTFAIDALRIGQMQVCRERKDRLEEGTERGLEVGAGELGVGHIQTDAHAGLLAELLDEGGVDEQVVIALPTKVPGEGGHGLGNDLHLA